MPHHPSPDFDGDDASADGARPLAASTPSLPPSPIPPPALDPLRYEPSMEQAEEDEHETGEALTATLLQIGDKTFEDSGRGWRTVHAKSHGLVEGRFIVGSLAPPHDQGLFGRPGEYRALIRLSTSPGDVLDDRVSTPRGMAIKVLDVPGPRVDAPAERGPQDFLMVDAPAFLAPDGRRFLRSLKALAVTTDRIPRLKLAFAAAARAGERLVEAAGGESGTLKSLGGHAITHPLGETYFSQTPFLFGPYVAKWSCVPVDPRLVALKDAPVDLDERPDGLREACHEHLSMHGGEWAFRVQLCTDLDRMPIEDASVEWSDEDSPPVIVARLIVPPQPGWSDERDRLWNDGLSFSPWHALAAHRPLGSINRLRRGAYQASADQRSPRGRCPVHPAPAGSPDEPPSPGSIDPRTRPPPNSAPEFPYP